MAPKKSKRPRSDDEEESAEVSSAPASSSPALSENDENEEYIEQPAPKKPKLQLQPTKKKV